MDEFRVIEIARRLSATRFDDSPTVRARSRSTRSARAGSGTRSAPTSSRCTAAARAPSSSIRPRSADFTELEAAIARRGVGAARREPGPRLPARGRPRPRAHLRHRARGATARACRASGSAPVVEELLGIHLAKEHSAADWSTRPLPAGVARSTPRSTSSCSSTCATRSWRAARRDRQDRARRAGVRRRAAQRGEAGRGRAVAAPLRHPRHAQPAQPRGRPRAVARPRRAAPRDSTSRPGRLVPDASLLAAARGAARSPSASSPTSRSSPAARAARELDRWWAAIERGLDDRRPARLSACPSDAPPPPRAWVERNPEADARLRPRARASRGRRADRHAGREPAHARSPAPRRVASAGRARPPRPSPPPSRRSAHALAG